MLPKLCFALGVPKVHHKKVSLLLHDAFKTYLDCKTISNLNNHEMLTFLSIVLMLCSREFGILLPFFHEPNDCEDLSMKEWLDLQRIIDK